MVQIMGEKSGGGPYLIKHHAGLDLTAWDGVAGCLMGARLSGLAAGPVKSAVTSWQRSKTINQCTKLLMQRSSG